MAWLLGQQEGEFVRAVTLPAYTGSSGLLRALYALTLAGIAAFGLFEAVVQRGENETHLRRCKPCSVALNAAAILLFALSRQPYVTAFLFLLFLVKVVLIIWEKPGS